MSVRAMHDTGHQCGDMSEIKGVIHGTVQESAYMQPSVHALGAHAH